MGPFQTAGRFDSCLDGMECTHVSNGVVECELTVTEGLTNSYSTLHGGAVSTIVDVMGTMALLSQDPTRAGVSVDMNQTFCGAAKMGARLLLRGRVLKAGRSMGFTEVAITDKASGRLLATGRHTKALQVPH